MFSGLFAQPLATAKQVGAFEHLSGEVASMFWPFDGGDAVGGRDTEGTLNNGQQLRFIVVGISPGTVGKQCNLGFKEGHEKDPCRFQPLIEIDCRQQCFENICQHGIALGGPAGAFALANKNVAAKIEVAGKRRKGGSFDQCGAQLGQFALAAGGEALKQQIGGKVVDHRIAKKLQPLGVSQAVNAVGMLVAI